MRIFFYIIFFLCSIYPQSEDATLTIYKDGSALIKQPVAWSIPSGNSYVTWGNLPSGIHRDTPFLNVKDVDVLSQRFNVKPKDGKLVKGLLLEISSTSLSLEHQSGVICFNRDELEYIGSKKHDLNSHTFHPYLSWDLKSQTSKVIEGELVYKTNSFSWNTVYRLKMGNEERGELIAEAVVSNISDIGFQNANLQLVEGTLNKVRKRHPMRESMNRSAGVALSNDVVPLIGKEELGDYHIYSLNNKHDLSPKENITVRMYGPLEVGYKKTYVFENSERRQKEEPLEVQISMENTESNGLGISLPGGKVEMYAYKKSSGLEYIGADNMGQVPKGQSTTLTSGRAFDVIGNRKVLNYDRQRKSEEAVIEIKVTNTRNEDINVLLVEHINGDWIIKDESLNYQKKDASTVHFPLVLYAGETKNVYYTYRKEWK